MPNPRPFFIAVLLFCAGFVCPIACKSATTKAETAKAEQNLDDIASDAQDIDTVVRSSTASPAVKATVQKKTESITEKAQETKKTVESQGATIDRMTAEITGLHAQIADLKIYRAIVWGFCAAVILAILGYVAKKLFFNKLPIPLP